MVLPVKRYDEWYDDFSVIPLDVNGDGYPDFITGGGGVIRCGDGRIPEKKTRSGPSMSLAKPVM